MKATFLKCIVNNSFVNVSRSSFIHNIKPNGFNLIKQFELNGWNKPLVRYQSTSSYGMSNTYATDSKSAVPPPATSEKAVKQPKNPQLGDDVLLGLKRISPNSYALFMKESFSQEKAKNPELKATQVVRKLASAWRSLPFEKKSQYMTQADQLRKALQTEKSKIFENKTEEEIANLKKEVTNSRSQRKKELSEFRTKRAKHIANRPKKPMSSFGFYLQTLDRGDASLQDFAKGASLKWKALAAEDKVKFEVEAKKGMEKYKEELKKWEAKMLAEGRIELVRKVLKDSLRKDLKADVKPKKRKSPKKKVTKKLAKKPIKKLAKKVTRKVGKKTRKTGKKAAPKKKTASTA